MKRALFGLAAAMACVSTALASPMVVPSQYSVQHHSVSTSSVQAQAAFDEGLTLLYAFNRLAAKVGGLPGPIALRHDVIDIGEQVKRQLIAIPEAVVVFKRVGTDANNFDVAIRERAVLPGERHEFGNAGRQVVASVKQQ